MRHTTGVDATGITEARTRSKAGATNGRAMPSTKKQAHHSLKIDPRDLPVRALAGFAVITFAITWGLIGVYIFFPDQAASSFGEISGQMSSSVWRSLADEP